MLKLSLLVISLLTLTSCLVDPPEDMMLNSLTKLVRQKTVYKNDPEDHWQTAKETIKLRSGDCEDFAILYAAILLQEGYTPEQLSLGLYEEPVSGLQHLVLIVNNKYILDNFGLSYFDIIYREKFIFKGANPIYNEVSTKDFYNLPPKE